MPEPAGSGVSVWAPFAKRVELVLPGSASRQPLEPVADGWWRRSEGALHAGTDYAFSLDGGPPLPDPRSPWQPEGVHGPSRTLDHQSFAWTDAGWRPPSFADAVVYELHVGTFTPAGTFDGAIDRLDYLRWLGITHLELMPVAEFPGRRGWGYDVADLFAPHHAYGGPEGLKRLVDAAHHHGLAVLLDVVCNHLGPDGAYLAAFGPYLSERHRTMWGPAVNLDGQGSDEVRRCLLDNALMWLRDYHLDGLRLDAVHALIDQSATHFLEELSVEVDELESALGRELVLVAESDLNDPRLVTPRDRGGLGLDAQWNDDFRHALHVALTGERTGIHGDFAGLPDLARALESGYVYTGQRSAYRGRRHGRPPLGLEATRFVAFLQNHDQVGNRPFGERSAALVSPAALQVAAAIVLGAPFVPLLFAGEEWAASSPFLFFSDHGDPEIVRAVREGRRMEFADYVRPGEELPDPQDPATFERSRLDWSELDREPHRTILEWHRRLIEIRKRLPDLRDGRLARVRFDEAEGWLAVERGAVRLLANLTESERRVPFEADPANARVLLASAAVETTEAQPRNMSIGLPPLSVALLGSGSSSR